MLPRFVFELFELLEVAGSGGGGAGATMAPMAFFCAVVVAFATAGCGPSALGLVGATSTALDEVCSTVVLFLLDDDCRRRERERERECERECERRCEPDLSLWCCLEPALLPSFQCLNIKS